MHCLVCASLHHPDPPNQSPCLNPIPPTHTATPPADQPRSVRFVIPGDPQPLRRHRVANNRMYNPSAGEQKRFLERVSDRPTVFASNDHTNTDNNNTNTGPALYPPAAAAGAPGGHGHLPDEAPPEPLPVSE